MWNPFKKISKSLKERDIVLAKQEAEEIVNLKELEVDGVKQIVITIYGLPVSGGELDKSKDMVSRLIELRKRYVEFRSYMR